MRQRFEVWFWTRVHRLLRRVLRGRVPALASVCAVLEEDGRLLFVRRRDGRGLNLPGGFLLWGEPVVAGIARETREETGYEVAVEDLLGVCGTALLVYQVRRVGGALRGSYEGDPVWLTRAEAEAEGVTHATWLALRLLGEYPPAHPNS